MAGNPVTTRWDPCYYSPIHQDDINAQAAALLDAAGGARADRQLGGRRAGDGAGVGRVLRRARGRHAHAQRHADRRDLARLDRELGGAHRDHGTVHGGLEGRPAPGLRGTRARDPSPRHRRVVGDRGSHRARVRAGGQHRGAVRAGARTAWPRCSTSAASTHRSRAWWSPTCRASTSSTTSRVGSRMRSVASTCS